METSVSHFLDVNKIVSHCKAVMLIVALRGYGKTYGTKEFAVKRHLKHGEEFIYIKRHKDDLAELDTFFDSLSLKYPEHEFSVKGKRFYCDGNLCGRAIPLSRWQKIKSSEFPNVSVIIFDEFIKEKDLSYYLPNEVEAFLNVIDTIGRNKDNFWVFMLGNAVTMANPYFLYFGLFPKRDQEIYKKGEFLVNIPKAEIFKEERKNTLVGRIIKGTNYEKFSLYNEWKDDNEVFIEKRTPNSKYIATFECEGKLLGLWFDKNASLLYLSDKCNPKFPTHIVTSKEDYDEGKTLVSGFKNNYHTLKLGKAFLKGQLRFDDIYTRELGYELLKQLKVQ